MVLVQGFDVARVEIGQGVNVIEGPGDMIASLRPFTVLIGHASNTDGFLVDGDEGVAARSKLKVFLNWTYFVRCSSLMSDRTTGEELWDMAGPTVVMVRVNNNRRDGTVWDQPMFAS